VAGAVGRCRRQRGWRLPVGSAPNQETRHHQLHEQRDRRAQPTGPGPDRCWTGAQRAQRRDRRSLVAIGAHENRCIISEKNIIIHTHNIILHLCALYHEI